MSHINQVNAELSQFRSLIHTTEPVEAPVQSRRYARVVRSVVGLALGACVLLGVGVARAETLSPADYLLPVGPPAPAAPHAPRLSHDKGWVCSTSDGVAKRCEVRR